MSDITELYQELIIDHGRHPRNLKSMDDASVSQDGFNPLCGDKLTLFLKIDHDRIIDASFIGSGCAISVASSSLMTESLKGKTIAEAKKIFEAFHDLVTKGNASHENSLGKLAALKGVHDYPARVKCATLAWQTMMVAISEQ